MKASNWNPCDGGGIADFVARDIRVVHVKTRVFDPLGCKRSGELHQPGKKGQPLLRRRLVGGVVVEQALQEGQFRLMTGEVARRTGERLSDHLCILLSPWSAIGI